MTRNEAGPPRRLWVWTGLALSLAILAYLVFGHDLGRLLKVTDAIRWKFVAGGLVCAMASYANIGLALWEILSLLGYSRPFSEVFGVAFVSNTANYFISSAGVSGFALKAHLLRKRQVPYGTTVLASVISTALMYFVLALIIGQGFAYQFLRMGGTKIAVMEGALGLGVLVLTSVPLMLFFFHHRIRGNMTRFIFRWVNFAVYSFSKREIPQEDFKEFEEQLTEGLALVRRETTRLARAIGYTCLDWFFAILVLYFSFRAVGRTLSVGHLSIAFAVGQMMTLVPLLPGGLGLMEGAMTATLQSLGIGWEKALVAVLLYRLCYHLIPGMGSIFILWGLKVSEPRLIEDTVSDALPKASEQKAAKLERHRQPSARGDKA